MVEVSCVWNHITAVTYFEVGSNLIGHLLEWEYVFFLPGDILKDGLLQKSSLLL